MVGQVRSPNKSGARSSHTLHDAHVFILGLSRLQRIIPAWKGAYTCYDKQPARSPLSDCACRRHGSARSDLKNAPNITRWNTDARKVIAN